MSPVRLAMRDSMRGPISSWSWKAKVKSCQPERDRTLCDVPDWRFIIQPIRNKADSTNRALVDGHWLMLAPQKYHGVPRFFLRVQADRLSHAMPEPQPWKSLLLDSVRIPWHHANQVLRLSTDRLLRVQFRYSLITPSVFPISSMWINSFSSV